MPFTKLNDSRSKEKLAVLEARLLARKLRGLPPHEVEALARVFVGAFLSELLHQGDMDMATVLAVANVPMDLVIARQREAREAAHTA